MGDYLISTVHFDPDYCFSLLHGRTKSKRQELVESTEGYTFSETQVLRIQLIEKHITYLAHSIELINLTLDRMIDDYEPVIQLLCTMPSVKRASAIEIISEIGTDMTQFRYSKQLLVRLGWLQVVMNRQVRKKQFVSLVLEFI